MPRTFPGCTCSGKTAARCCTWARPCRCVGGWPVTCPPRGRRARTGAGEGGRDGRRARSLEWIVTSSEVEALLLEHNLIKRHRPQYNIRLRDDKSYPYIVVTHEDEFPRVLFTRQPHRRGNQYFGPYASAAKVRETLDTLGRIFPFRKCRGARPGRSSGSPCLQFHIKRCPGSLRGRHHVGGLRGVVGQVVRFPLWTERTRGEATRGGDAAGCRRPGFRAGRALPGSAGGVAARPSRSSRCAPTCWAAADIIGMARDEQRANVQVFLTRDGILTDRRSFILEAWKAPTTAECSNVSWATTTPPLWWCRRR